MEKSLQYLLRYPLYIGERKHIYIFLEDIFDSVCFKEEGGVSVFDPGHLGEGGHIISKGYELAQFLVVDGWQFRILYFLEDESEVVSGVVEAMLNLFINWLFHNIVVYNGMFFQFEILKEIFLVLIGDTGYMFKLLTFLEQSYISSFLTTFTHFIFLEQLKNVADKGNTNFLTEIIVGAVQVIISFIDHLYNFESQS